MGCGRSKPATPTATPTAAPTPAPAPGRALTQEETELIDNVINVDNAGILEGISSIGTTYENDPIVFAKFFIVTLTILDGQFDYNSFKTDLRRRITNEIRSTNTPINMESFTEIVSRSVRDATISRTTSSFTRDEATYFNSLLKSVGESLDQYGDVDNRPTNFYQYLVNKCYTLTKSSPRPSMSSATTNAVTDITTRFNLTLNSGTTTTVAGFQNKNSFIMKELEKIKQISKGSTETFRNKEVKENFFTGYNLEHNSLLPKEYAEF
jgi:hypothetical protein